MVNSRDLWFGASQVRKGKWRTRYRERYTVGSDLEERNLHARIRA